MNLFPLYRSYKFIIADILFELQRYSEAAQAYRDTIMSPEHNQAWFGLGQCLTPLAHCEEALMACEKAIEINPEYADALYYSAMLYTFLYQPAKAQTCLNKAITLQPHWEARVRQDPLLQRYFSEQSRAS